jgi:plasmid stabilization system protein ParE
VSACRQPVAADLNEIEVYTVRIWGERQSAAYLADPFDAFDLISDKPDMGVLRLDMRLAHCARRGPRRA